MIGKPVTELLTLVASNAKRQVGRAQELGAKSNSLRDASRETIKDAKAIVKRSRSLRLWLKKAA